MNYSPPPPPPSTTSSPPSPSNTQQKSHGEITLVVKRIPPSLTCSSEKQRDFFMKYGASQVRSMEGKNMKGMAFLDFESRESAQRAYQQLDKLYIDMARKGLCVEYAIGDRTRQNNVTSIIDHRNQQPSSISAASKGSPSTTSPNANVFPTTGVITTAASVPVAAELGLNYASNPHLLYRYPNPTPDILNNMMNAIGTVPRLYTQVLHLMNKMNLPPPFDSAISSTPASTPSLLKRKRDELLASDESEIEPDDEADEEEQKLQLRRMTAQQKRKQLKKDKSLTDRLDKDTTR